MKEEGPGDLSTRELILVRRTYPLDEEPEMNGWRRVA